MGFSHWWVNGWRMAWFDGGARRRAVLKSTAIATALAGCSRVRQGSDPDEDDDGGDGDGELPFEESPTATPTEPPTEEPAEEPPTEDADPVPGATLEVAQQWAPEGFDPIATDDEASMLVVDRMFEGLYHYDEGTGHVPVLADGLPAVNDAGDVWTVDLDPRARFHTGAPVTAEDVRYSFLAPVEERTETASRYEVIDAVEVVDDTTVRFELDRPYGPFVHVLHGKVVPAAVRGELGLKNDPDGAETPVPEDPSKKRAFDTENPVGSGPFRFVDWVEGEYVELERWDDYWGGDRPSLGGVRFEPIQEATSRVASLQSGESHVVTDVTPRVWDTVESASDAGVEAEPDVTYFYVAFNCKEGPTTERTVREAVDYAVDMDEAVSRFVAPAGVRQYSPLPAPVAEEWGMPTDEWRSIPHEKDVHRAASLLEDAGVPEDYDWTIIVPPDDEREQVGVSVANGIEAAGWENVTVRRLDWGPFLERYVSGDADDYNMYVLGWSGLPDPDAFTYYLFGRTADTLGVTNGCFYGANSENGRRVAESFRQARETGTRRERRSLYESAITTLLEDRAHLPAYTSRNSFGVADVVDGFDVHPVDRMHVSSAHNDTALDG